MKQNQNHLEPSLGDGQVWNAFLNDSRTRGAGDRPALRCLRPDGGVGDEGGSVDRTTAEVCGGLGDRNSD